ncbi:hypothetical protein HNR19_004277 [Nocardioides thalensis]|uniref:Uncharacterized protein n=1 Tax=Nocardioides thalensis TaxID=1914755 RepID=A0A853C8Q1_9ACTN|nr:hypothetical protein [Nocardioides thalensis]NYJ03579.1 hypothetical protein [Nocardioides thalensis]
MTSPTDDERQDGPASAADDAAVRRLLADARAAGPVPPEVASRLDATLAGLVADREQEAGPADGTTDDTEDDRTAAVVPLASRRRRTAAGLLVAAAALVVGGVAVGQYLDQSSSPDQASAGADADGGAVDRGEAEAADDLGSAKAPSDGTGPGEMVLGNEDRPALRTLRIKAPATTPQVRTGHLKADLEWLQIEKLDGVRRGYYLGSFVVLPRGFQCAPAAWGPGIHFGVRYDGRSAMAAFREPQGDNQVVDVLQCDTADVLRSTTLPSRARGGR